MDAETKALVERLRDIVGQAIFIMEECTVSSGFCGCGDSMERHADPMLSGHSPVDYGSYVANRWLNSARAALAGEAGK